MKYMFITAGYGTRYYTLNWITQNGLLPYFVDIAAECNACADGSFPLNEAKALLREKLKSGALVVLEGQSMLDIDKLFAIAKWATYKFNYECVIVPFYLGACSNLSIPKYLSIMGPDRAQNFILSFDKVDLSKYDEVVHIGDIHGCYTVLHDALSKDGGLSPNKFYIFLGDYIDRGIENAAVLDFIYSIKDAPNVVLLEGNHDINLLTFHTKGKGVVGDFDRLTVPDLLKRWSFREAQGVCYAIYKKLKPCFLYTYRGIDVFCNHGGVERPMKEGLKTVDASYFIQGVGSYRDMESVANTYAKASKWFVRPLYEVHGHRNVYNVPAKINDYVYNICDSVEFGGNLRVLSLQGNAFTCSYYRNYVFWSLGRHVKFYNAAGEVKVDTDLLGEHELEKLKATSVKYKRHGAHGSSSSHSKHNF